MGRRLARLAEDRRRDLATRDLAAAKLAGARFARRFVVSSLRHGRGRPGRRVPATAAFRLARGQAVGLVAACMAGCCVGGPVPAPARRAEDLPAVSRIASPVLLVVWRGPGPVQPRPGPAPHAPLPPATPPRCRADRGLGPPPTPPGPQPGHRRAPRAWAADDRSRSERRLRRVHHPLDPGAFRFRQLGQAAASLGIAGALVSVSPVAFHPLVTLALVLGTPRRWSSPPTSTCWPTSSGARPVRSSANCRRWPSSSACSWPPAACGCCHRPPRPPWPRAPGRGPPTGHPAWAQQVDERTALRSGPISVRARASPTSLASSPSQGRPPTSTVSSSRKPTRSAEAHRELLADLERRSQQVWVPVTVATLLPGSLLLLVPFLDARLFAGA